MATTPEVIHARIAAALPDAQIAVRDTTGTYDHFDVVVVSPSFTGKMLIDRHRMIYAALGDAMRAEIHALALTTLTPAEKEKRK